MSRILLTVTKSDCRCGYLKQGDQFIVDDLCPPICQELWHIAYPYVLALKNGATLDYGETKAACFDASCPDNGRVSIHGERMDG